MIILDSYVRFLYNEVEEWTHSSAFLCSKDSENSARNIQVNCTCENTLQKALCYDKMIVSENDKKITILILTNFTI